MIAQLKQVPLALMQTREIDIHADGGDAAGVADLIDGSIGEGSQFDETFGYYAHGLEEGAAILPSDWRTRAVTLPLEDQPGVVCICPGVDDIALSKLCAWRGKDRTWLGTAQAAGLLDMDQIRSRFPLLDGTAAPPLQELERRADALAQPAGSPSPGSGATG